MCFNKDAQYQIPWNLDEQDGKAVERREMASY